MEAEPTHEGSSDLAVGEGCRVGIDRDGSSRRFRDELRLTATIHCNKPPRRLVNRLSDSQQAVIAENGGFAIAQGFADAFSFAEIENDSSIVVKKGVVV